MPDKIGQIGFYRLLLLLLLLILRQYDLRVTRSGRVILLLLPPLKKAILIKITHNGDKVVHELPIQLSKDSVLVDLDDSVAVLLDDRDRLYKIGLPGKLILSKRKGLREVLFS